MDADGEVWPRPADGRGAAGDRETVERVVARLRSQDAPAGHGSLPRREWAGARQARSHRESGPPGAPAWASRSVVEDGGVTHELVSQVRPLVLVRVHGGGIGRSALTEVSVSVVDRPRGNGWARQSPRIQVEGGSYPLAEAHLLAAAIEQLIAQVRS